MKKFNLYRLGAALAAFAALAIAAGAGNKF
jgi:hypothetical protein